MSNLLAQEASPYLQRHKDNPIAWFPWCDSAFLKAKNENKPIFISIGYCASHWCRIMEKESFQNLELANFINNHFVCIKVDKDERPDIDRYYQEVYQIINRRPGGWPTSIFATPENKPFYAGNYIPLTTQDDTLGFTQLTSVIAQKVAQKDIQIFNNANDITTHIQEIIHPTQATKLSRDIATIFLQQATMNYQEGSGGFTVAPKFPHTSTLNFLLNIALIQDNASAKEMLLHTLKQMQQGGMYDIVEGGFCRYSVDENWQVPHPEKTCADNALLIQLYTLASLHFKEASFITTAQESADFMLNTMQENHLFYSVNDAKQEDGANDYYTFSIEELEAILTAAHYSKEDIDAIHITLNTQVSQPSFTLHFNGQIRPTWLKHLKSDLYTLRQQRIKPFIDKSIQVVSNAMMIRSLFVLSITQEQYLENAIASLDALLNTLLIDGELYHVVQIGQQPTIKAFLEDYAYLGVALMQGYDQTCDERYIIMAQQLANQALEHFYDRGRWFFTRGDLQTQAHTRDSGYPGEIGVMVELLLSLGSIVDQKYRNFAFKTLEYYSFDVSQRPLHFPTMSNQMYRYVCGDSLIKDEHHTLLRLHTNTLPHYPYTYKKAIKK